MLSARRLSKGKKYNHDVVKKLMGQGLLYVRIRRGFEFLIEQTLDPDPDVLMANLVAEIDAKTEAHLESEDKNMPQSASPDELPVLGLWPGQQPITIDLSHWGTSSQFI